jgi:branched-chain amino acid transport system ATP-binding protein
MITVRNLEKSYKTRAGVTYVLRQINLEIAEGDFVTFMGPSGAGKSTLLSILGMFDGAFEGEYDFLGQAVHKLTPKERAALNKRHVGFVFQQFHLLDDLTVAENLEVAAERQSAGSFLADLVHPRRQREHGGVVYALDVLDLADLAARMPNELSQGQRKLVSAARALAARPKLVCMDEPAAGLDTAESEALGARLRSIIDAGITILLVDHDMGLVLSISDEVVVLEFGKVIAAGKPEAVRTNPQVVSAYLGSAAAELAPQVGAS